MISISAHAASQLVCRSKGAAAAFSSLAIDALFPKGGPGCLQPSRPAALELLPGPEWCRGALHIDRASVLSLAALLHISLAVRSSLKPAKLPTSVLFSMSQLQDVFCFAD
jgi:hypothetical protein